ncbi:MAG: ABC transporter permease, partial [bacterium]
LLHRLLFLPPLLLAVSFVTFLILYLTPGDPVKIMLGEKAIDPVAVEKMRNQLGLNDPFLVQFGRFAWRAAHGNLGRSLRTNRPVAEELSTRLPATVEITVTALFFALSLGLFSGILAAWKHSTVFDYGSMVVALAGVSIPVFWLALLLNYFFGVVHPWLPLTDRLSTGVELEPITHFFLLDSILRWRFDVFWDALRHIFLPSLTLGLIDSALIARMTRSSLLEEMSQDYKRTGEAKGLGPGRLLWHVLRNALIPIVTIVGLQFGALLGGAIITESIYSWPGVGTYLIHAILSRDIPAVQGTVLLLTTLFVLVNLAVDVAYTWVDPRVQYDPLKD